VNASALVADHGRQKPVPERRQGCEIEALRFLKVGNVKSYVVEHGFSTS
jgi:hypothetical protein